MDATRLASLVSLPTDRSTEGRPLLFFRLWGLPFGGRERGVRCGADHRACGLLQTGRLIEAERDVHVLYGCARSSLA